MPDEKARLLNLLVAFPYVNPGILRLLVQNKERVRFLLDSGAFTAWKSGKPIKLDDYCRFIESLPVKPWRYFVLDVIGDAHGTLKNYETMLKRGFKPVPIFTRGEDPSVLEDYYKTSDVVGVGGLVGTSGNTGFVNGIMKKIGSRRCHWLGFTRFNFMKHYRPYMCDSSSWESGARFATFHLYMGGGRTKAVKKSQFASRPPDELVRAIASYGYNARDLAKGENWRGGYSTNRCLNGASAVRMSLDVQKNLGTLFFSAATTEHAVKILFDGHHFEMKGKRPS